MLSVDVESDEVEEEEEVVVVVEEEEEEEPSKSRMAVRLCVVMGMVVEKKVLRKGK